MANASHVCYKYIMWGHSHSWGRDRDRDMEKRFEYLQNLLLARLPQNILSYLFVATCTEQYKILMWQTQTENSFWLDAHVAMHAPNRALVITWWARVTQVLAVHWWSWCEIHPHAGQQQESPRKTQKWGKCCYLVHWGHRWSHLLNHLVQHCP